MNDPKGKNKGRIIDSGSLRQRVFAWCNARLDRGLYPERTDLAAAFPGVPLATLAGYRKLAIWDYPGPIPGRNSGSGLPCATEAQRRRVWRRAAILRAITLGLPRPHGNRREVRP